MSAALGREQLSPARLRVVPAILFVAAFAAVVVMSNRDRFSFDRAGAEGAAGPATHAPAARAGDGAAHGAQHALPASADAQPATDLDAPSTPAAKQPAVPVAPKHVAPTREQLKAIEDLKQQVAAPTEEGGAMEEREARGDAIREVAKLSGPQATQALIATLRNDSDRRNRILAIQGLLNAANAADEDGAARAALREASTSSDEVIAQMARDALSK